MIPLYAFVEGDTAGLVVFADEGESVGELADKVQRAASVRLAPSPGARVFFKGAELDPAMVVADQFTPLDRIDVVPAKGGAR